MDAAHSFLSLGRSCSDWRNLSASVASVRSASTKSNFSGDAGATIGVATVAARPVQQVEILGDGIDDVGRHQLFLIDERAHQAVFATAD